MKIYLIVSKYLDGELKAVIGYCRTEEEADKIIKKLNNNLCNSDSFKYDYNVVDKIKVYDFE